jgi:hypothetical protein
MPLPAEEVEFRGLSSIQDMELTSDRLGILSKAVTPSANDVPSPPPPLRSFPSE